MTTARFALVLLPATAIVLACYAARPARAKGSGTVAPVRLGVLRGAVAVGAGAVLAVEGLSAAHAIRTAPVVACWIVACLLALAVAGLRHRVAAGAQRQVGPRPAALWLAAPWRALGRQGAGRLADAVRGGWRAVWTTAGWFERAVAVGLVGLAVSELVLALAASPNNYDSYYYHLPKVEQWVARESVGPYPTLMLPQVLLVPGAEYLLLHLRLLTGDDGAYNLVQWAAGLGAAVAISRIAAQLGAGRRGQLLAMFTVMTAPMVVLQSTSTQTDLTAAAWVAAAASLVLDDLRGRAGVAGVCSIGAAVGLAAVTKSTTLLCLAPVLLLWGLARLRAVVARSAPGRLAALGRLTVDGLAVLVIASALVGPFMVRMQQTFGDPLGGTKHTQGLTLERHEPPVLVVNALRMMTSTLVVPVESVNRAVSGSVIDFAGWLGVDPQDPRTTLGHGEYPDPRWGPDEDHAPFPLQSAVVLLATAAVLVRRRVPAIVRAYGGTVCLTMVLYASVLKWQLWGNRLVVPVLVLGSPLAGWYLARILPGRDRDRASRESASRDGASRDGTGVGGSLRSRRWRPAAVGTVAAVIALTGFAGAYTSAYYGWPRRMLGDKSVFVLDEWDQRFVRIPEAAASYRYAAAAVAGSGAHRVGIVTRRADDWEYPWWLALPGRELVAMQSAVPGHPPAAPSSVDALVCYGPPADCMAYAQPGWRYVSDTDWIGAAVPPQKSANTANPRSAQRR